MLFLKAQKIKFYDDLNFIQRFFYKIRLAKMLRKQCKFTCMMDSLLDCRSEKSFNELIRECF